MNKQGVINIQPEGFHHGNYSNLDTIEIIDDDSNDNTSSNQQVINICPTNMRDIEGGSHVSPIYRRESNQIPTVIDSTNAKCILHNAALQNYFDAALYGKSHWFTEFSWMQYNRITNLLICKYCSQTHSSGSLAVGREPVKTRRIDLIVHTQTDTHIKIVSHFSGGVSGCADTITVESNSKYCGQRKILIKKSDMTRTSSHHNSASQNQAGTSIPATATSQRSSNIHYANSIDTSQEVHCEVPTAVENQTVNDILRAVGQISSYSNNTMPNHNHTGVIQNHHIPAAASIPHRYADANINNSARPNHLLSPGVLTIMPESHGGPGIHRRESAMSSHHFFNHDHPQPHLHHHRPVHHQNHHLNYIDYNSRVNDIPPPITPPIITYEVLRQMQKETYRGVNGKKAVEALISHFKLRTDWFTEFRWLEYNTQLNSFYCIYCRIENTNSIFTRGKSFASSTSKRNDFIIHIETDSHKNVMMAYQLREQQNQDRRNSADAYISPVANSNDSYSNNSQHMNVITPKTEIINENQKRRSRNRESSEIIILDLEENNINEEIKIDSNSKTDSQDSFDVTLTNYLAGEVEEDKVKFPEVVNSTNAVEVGNGEKNGISVNSSVGNESLKTSSNDSVIINNNSRETNEHANGGNIVESHVSFSVRRTTDNEKHTSWNAAEVGNITSVKDQIAGVIIKPEIEPVIETYKYSVNQSFSKHSDVKECLSDKLGNENESTHINSNDMDCKSPNTNKTDTSNNMSTDASNNMSTDAAKRCGKSQVAVEDHGSKSVKESPGQNLKKNSMADILKALGTTSSEKDEQTLAHILKAIGNSKGNNSINATTADSTDKSNRSEISSNAHKSINNENKSIAKSDNGNNSSKWSCHSGKKVGTTLSKQNVFKNHYTGRKKILQSTKDTSSHAAKLKTVAVISESVLSKIRNSDRVNGVKTAESLLTRFHLKANWFSDFIWLQYNTRSRCFFCKYCKMANTDSIFSRGKSAIKSRSKRCDFIVHRDTDSHGNVMRIYESHRHEKNMRSSNSGKSNTADRLERNEVHRHKGKILTESSSSKSGNININSETVCANSINDHQRNLASNKHSYNTEDDPGYEDIKPAVTSGSVPFRIDKTFSLSSSSTVSTTLPTSASHSQNRESQSSIHGHAYNRSSGIDHSISRSPYRQSNLLPGAGNYTNSPNSCSPTGSHNLKWSTQVSESPRKQCRTATQEPVPHGYTPFHNNFWSMANIFREENILCDINLAAIAPETGSVTKFPAHKLVLISASKFLREKLINQPKQVKVLAFPNVSVIGLKGVLDFLYGQNVLGDAGLYSECYKAACALDIMSAKVVFKNLLGSVCTEEELIEVVLGLPNSGSGFGSDNGGYHPSDLVNDNSSLEGSDYHEREEYGSNINRFYGKNRGGKNFVESAANGNENIARGSKDGDGSFECNQVKTEENICSMENQNNKSLVQDKKCDSTNVVSKLVDGKEQESNTCIEKGTVKSNEMQDARSISESAVGESGEMQDRRSISESAVGESGEISKQDIDKSKDPDTSHSNTNQIKILKLKDNTIGNGCMQHKRKRYSTEDDHNLVNTTMQSSLEDNNQPESKKRVANYIFCDSKNPNNSLENMKISENKVINSQSFENKLPFTCYVCRRKTFTALGNIRKLEKNVNEISKHNKTSLLKGGKKGLMFRNRVTVLKRCKVCVRKLYRGFGKRSIKKK